MFQSTPPRGGRHPCEDCGAFAIMNVYVYGTQSSVSIIGLNYGVAEPDWSLSDMAWADSITFDANYNQTESVLVAADPIESGVDNAVWPWAQGQTAQFGTEGVHGPHPSTSPATDWFLKSASFSGDGPNSVVASQSARVDWSCREPSTNQIGVHAGAFTYIHLVNQPGLHDGSQLTRGVAFASLVSGTFDGGRCGFYSDQQAGSMHIHWGIDKSAFPGGRIVIQNWALDTGNNKWVNTVTGDVVSVGGLITAGSNGGGDPGPGPGPSPIIELTLFDGIVNMIVARTQYVVEWFPEQNHNVAMVAMITAAMTIPIRVAWVLTNNRFNMTIPLLSAIILIPSFIIKIIMVVWLRIKSLIPFAG